MKAIRRSIATAAVLLAGLSGVATGAAAQSVYSGTVSIQQVTVGGLTVSPTSSTTSYPRLSVGYDFRVAGLAQGASDRLTMDSPAWVFSWRCVSSPTTTGQWHVNATTASRTVTTTGWRPALSPTATSFRQRTVALPDSCNGGRISVRQGTFISAFTASLPTPVSFRWRYIYCTSATACIGGTWTDAFTVTPQAGGVYPPPAVGGLHLVRPPAVQPAPQPSPLPFTGLELGAMITAAVAALVGGGLFVRAGRRRRRAALTR